MTSNKATDRQKAFSDGDARLRAIGQRMQAKYNSVSLEGFASNRPLSPYYSTSYSLITASPVLSCEPTCNRHYIEYTYQQHNLREVTAWSTAYRTFTVNWISLSDC